MDQLLLSGVSESEAFRSAVAQLGAAPAIASEFRKLDEPAWLPIRVVTGLGIAGGLGLAVVLLARMGVGRSELLIATHVFTVTLGYAATLLVGTLGLCFVMQRCLLEFSPARVSSIHRVTFRFGCVALVLTAVGVLLGMFWSKANWGRYWDWDVKEIGGFSVLVWQMIFLFVHRLSRSHGRGVIVAGILGNIVVGLAWFGGNLLSELHSYGTLQWRFLLAAVAFNAALLLIGLAPAGWLRMRRD
jgi:ABC-type transport system involved in cytochrome c biogenesis permease subunit